MPTADLIDTADLLEYLGLPETTEPRLYERLITGASLAIEGFCQNALVQRTFTEVYARPYGSRNLRLRHYPIVSISSIADPSTVDVNGLPTGNLILSTSYVVVSREGIVRHAGYWPSAVDANGNPAEWTIVYVAGRFARLEDVTEDLKLACRLLVAHRSSVRTPGIASKTAGDRSISYRSPETGDVSGMPSEVAGLLSPYVSHLV